jgi:hypothetical protein
MPLLPALRFCPWDLELKTIINELDKPNLLNIGPSMCCTILQVAIVSQEESAMYVTYFDFDKLEFVPQRGEKVYMFPRTNHCEVMREGAAAVVSNQRVGARRSFSAYPSYMVSSLFWALLNNWHPAVRALHESPQGEIHRGSI